MGKEVFSQLIHQLSPRKHNPFIAVNCGAIPEGTIDSELFGHEKGAFTGAAQQRKGRFELAHGGTIFLDEIGDMSRSLQAKLLRFLEDGSFSRVGGNEELKVNVRLLAATNRDIIQAIRDNQFREDLYHRLNVVQFRPPPLRERGQDVCLLAEHFLKQFGGTLGKPTLTLAKPAAAKLLAHHWPGNVRELRNVIERAVILAPGPFIEPRYLPPSLVNEQTPTAQQRQVALAPGTTVEEAERRLIMMTLEHTRDNKTRAAEILGISLKTLHNKLNKLRGRGPGSKDDGEPLTP